METIQLFFQTVMLRPYVFIFLAVFLTAGFLMMGKTKTLVFLFSTWIVAFLCEYSSTRNGFPFGLYHYTGDTQGQELFFSNVPFFDSLSFTFLLFASYSMALFTLSPLRIEKRNIRILDTFAIRQGKAVLFFTTLYMTMIDVVIDPIALRGDKWFLGRIYWYDSPGYYFGVPLSNAVGWAIVGGLSLWLFQKVEKRFFPENPKTEKIPYQSLMGVGLYYGILLFMLGICWWIEERALLIASIFIYLMPTVLLLLRFRDPNARATEND